MATIGSKRKPQVEKVGRCFLWFKHKIMYIPGHGFKCKNCGKTRSKCLAEENRK